jgi:hypothetical protein
MKILLRNKLFVKKGGKSLQIQSLEIAYQQAASPVRRGGNGGISTAAYTATKDRAITDG